MNTSALVNSAKPALEEKKSQWTKPFHGVTHLGTGKWRLTITDRGSFADLSQWYPGCGFSPLSTVHDSVADAKAIGEQWLAAQWVSA